MLDSPVIDLVILLSFTYFTCSLILSSLNEGIAQGIFHLRERNLKKAIEVLFISDAWKEFTQTDFIQSPHIQSLMRMKGRYPTYIPANNFYLFVIEKIGSENLIESRLQHSIQSANLPEDFKRTLMDIAAQGNNKLEAFEQNLKQFYDDALEHSTVWYRKSIRRILLFMGFVLAVALNIDTIMISNDALTHEKDLGKTVDKIIEQLPNIEMNKDSTEQWIIRNKDGQVSVSQVANIGTGIPVSKSGSGDSSIKNVEKLRVLYEESTGYYLGYRTGEFEQQWFGHGLAGFLKKLLGMLITAFAVQLGSHYWYDLMKKAVTVRSFGQKTAVRRTVTRK